MRKIIRYSKNKTEKKTEIKQFIQPKVSIIMLSKDCLGYTKKCLDSLMQYTSNFELIIVDNGSDKKTIDYFKSLKKFREYKLVLNDKNIGVPYAWNQGIKLAKYDYIAIINNDVIFTPNWLYWLQKCFNDNPKCAVSSPTSCFTNGIQCDWNIVPRRFNMSQHDINSYAASLEYKYIETEIYGFCFLTHKKVIDKIGVFDYKRYGMGSCEEKDFNWRARQSGFKTYWVKHAYVHHYGHITFEQGDTGLDANKQCEISRKKFEDRIKNDNNLFIENDVEVEAIEIKHKYSKIIDVIIPVLDRQKQTTETLEALLANNKNINVIIVDNDSDDISYLNKFKVTIIKNKTNNGAIKALNQGLEIAKSEFIVLMHNDIAIHNKDWIDKAVKFMSDNPDVGIVGAAGWKKFEANGEYFDLFTMIDFYKRSPRKEFDEMATLDGCCVVIRNIGLTYDESYGLMHLYDHDMSMQYRKAGYKLFVMVGSAIHYADDRKNSTVWNSEKYINIRGKNEIEYYKERQDLFVAKWKNYLPIYIN